MMAGETEPFTSPGGSQMVAVGNYFMIGPAAVIVSEEASKVPENAVAFSI